MGHRERQLAAGSGQQADSKRRGDAGRRRRGEEMVNDKCPMRDDKCAMINDR